MTASPEVPPCRIEAWVQRPFAASASVLGLASPSPPARGSSPLGLPPVAAKEASPPAPRRRCSGRPRHAAPGPGRLPKPVPGARQAGPRLFAGRVGHRSRAASGCARGKAELRRCHRGPPQGCSLSRSLRPRPGATRRAHRPRADGRSACPTATPARTGNRPLQPTPRSGTASGPAQPSMGRATAAAGSSARAKRGPQPLPRTATRPFGPPPAHSGAPRPATAQATVASTATRRRGWRMYVSRTTSQNTTARLVTMYSPITQGSELSVPTFRPCQSAPAKAMNEER